MTVPDDFEEPCFLDYTDDPARFDASVERPAGPSWWRGWWPSGGINSLDDLTRWVEYRLDEMISLQGWDTLADLGRMLGVQALQNADRYLGQFGKGDHPPRPYDDQLQRVEDVENALEDLLRYLRLQQAQPAARPETTHAGADIVTASPSNPGSASDTPPLRSWVQSELDEAIYKYKAERAASYNSLREAIEAGRKGAVESARKMFGRNPISIALGVKARAMVSKSPAWREIADALRLRGDGLRRLKTSDKIGFDYAENQKASSAADPTASAVELRDAINLVRRKLKGERADAIVERLERGDMTAEQAEELVEMLVADPDDG
jgi:hypothetical protein